MADWEIINVYKDDLLGSVIEIRHENAVVTKYYNLLESELSGIKAGAKVKMGDVISGVGETALFEAGEGAHLHVEAMRNGVLIDPQELFK